VAAPSSDPELLPRHAHRALLYVERLNAVGFHPTADAVERFSESSGPRDAVYTSPWSANLGQMLSILVRNSDSTKISDAEPVVEWLIRMDWLSPLNAAGGLRLTDLGAALLAGLRESPPTFERSEEGSTAVVLDPSDPFVYAELTRLIASAGEALLVDPYFKSDMLSWLHDATRVTRLLMSGKGQQVHEVELVALHLHAIQGAPNAGRVEIRATDSAELHDRLLIPSDDIVSSLGTSITGVGRHLSAIVRMPRIASDALRVEYERLWSDAEPVQPRPLRRPTDRAVQQAAAKKASARPHRKKAAN
jgi:hypothetical protein